MALLRFTRTTAFHEAQDSRWPFPFTFDAKMPDQFCGAVCAAPFVVFQRRIEMAGVEGIGEISEKNVRPSLFGCPVPPAKFVEKLLKLRRNPLPQLSKGPPTAAVRALTERKSAVKGRVVSV